MKITAIMGSHRNNGHTNKILNYFLEQIREDNELRRPDGRAMCCLQHA